MSVLTQNFPVLPDMDMRRPGIIGAAAFVLLFGIMGTWAATTVIDGAVIASGQAMIQSRPQLVQSLDGGAVDEIFVRNGDVVTQGQILVRLDATVLTVNLDIALNKLAAAFALRARLQAEQLGLEAPVFRYPDVGFDLPSTAPHEASETAIFAARAAVLSGMRAQLVESRAQFDSQTEGVAGQIDALGEQIALLERDIENMRILTDEGLARQSQMTDLQRQRAQMTGQLAALQAQKAQLATTLRERELTTLQEDRSFAEEVVTQLRTTTALIEELVLQIVTHRAQLDRIDIRAPVDGVVHEMQISSLGGVVTPGETLLQVIPLQEGLDFEVRVDPRAVDQVHAGQSAQLVFSSFDPQSTPRLTAEVLSVSPDVVVDSRTGQSYYRANLTVSPDELARLEDMSLLPGMPVEAYLQTGERTVLTYLLDPIYRHLQRGFRE